MKIRVVKIRASVLSGGDACRDLFLSLNALSPFLSRHNLLSLKAYPRTLSDRFVRKSRLVQFSSKQALHLKFLEITKYQMFSQIVTLRDIQNMAKLIALVLLCVWKYHALECEQCQYSKSYHAGRLWKTGNILLCFLQRANHFTSGRFWQL